ncbi:MAG: 2-hydroxyacid dehydrogenase [Gammaproteobacteria bacterium]|nr:2-hydroxyacid dehydrogenase [Gammaproteobacteria bacterium]MBU1554356.1 2-hydroxyacid dehydrogenase [Gammaproteobacteria bacterium]MBU2069037.1 2-hydroxyacid dehydrogenase [Gammaproteobacteria bacterium]MBU2185160.1 2-hydroxyacid dehydrogenase [Gammaproteobacteria bacterium]MBU2207128.1 2-hydroxyacid dehydrogenase [Gammaproteobacteria bacterium]
MKVAVFSAKKYDRDGLNQWADTSIQFSYHETRLNSDSVKLASGCHAVCAFVNDELNAAVLQQLSQMGIEMVALRCAGFNNVDLTTAKALGIRIARVPAYSPEAVAEHTIGMMLCLNRKLHKAYNRVRDDNFALDGLLGFNLFGKTVGLIGTGRIGQATARILHGFGCQLLCHDIAPSSVLTELGARYVPLAELYAQSDIISLHCPLTPDTKHLINHYSIGSMKDGVMLINTSRGALIDSKAVIDGLKNRKIGYLGLDVYEQEADLFFENLSEQMIDDEIFKRLLTFPNVLITGHQAFFTKEALQEICQVTSDNLLAFASNTVTGNELVN